MVMIGEARQFIRHSEAVWLRSRLYRRVVRWRRCRPENIPRSKTAWSSPRALRAWKGACKSRPRAETSVRGWIFPLPFRAASSTRHAWTFNIATPLITHQQTPSQPTGFWHMGRWSALRSKVPLHLQSDQVDFSYLHYKIKLLWC